MNSDLGLDQYHKPYATLNRVSFQKPFRKPFGMPNPSSFRWLYGLKYR
jgi:hypothetical protein